MSEMERLMILDRVIHDMRMHEGLRPRLGDLEAGRAEWAAALKEAERERDYWKDSTRIQADATWAQHTRANAAEAVLTRLREALRQITQGPTTPGSNPTSALDLARDVIERSQEIARAALATPERSEAP